MDGHGNPEPNIKCIADCQVSEPPMLGEKFEHSDRHSEGNRRVRGWPPPEYTAAEEAESEKMGQIGVDAVPGMGTAGNRFVPSSD